MEWFAAAAIVTLVGVMILGDIKQRRQLRELTKRRDELYATLMRMGKLSKEQIKRWEQRNEST